MSDQTPHDQELTPPVEPGKGWVCDNGHRHFVCYGCRQVFTSSESVVHGDAIPGDEDTFSLCDDCAENLRRRLAAEGIVL